MLKWIDMPPVWLIAAMICAGVLARLVPGPEVGIWTWARGAGPVVFLLGLVLTSLSVLEFRRARTTIVPRRDPAALITSGIYRYSRNPIYLADALFLLAVVLWLGAALGLGLVALFIWVMNRRFIRAEEARLLAAFPDAYGAYKLSTRRWI